MSTQDDDNLDTISMVTF